MVFLSVDALVLDQIVEPSLVSSDAQILLDIVLFFFKLVLVEAAEDFIGLGALFISQTLDLCNSCLIIRCESTLGLKVLAFGGGTAQNLTLLAEFVRRTCNFNWSLVSAF